MPAVWLSGTFSEVLLLFSLTAHRLRGCTVPGDVQASNLLEYLLPLRLSVLDERDEGALIKHSSYKLES